MSRRYCCRSASVPKEESRRRKSGLRLPGLFGGGVTLEEEEESSLELELAMDCSFRHRLSAPESELFLGLYTQSTSFSSDFTSSFGSPDFQKSNSNVGSLNMESPLSASFRSLFSSSERLFLSSFLGEGGDFFGAF